MALASGLGSSLGFKKETVWGTPVTVDSFYEFDSESLALARTYVDSVGLRSGRTFNPASRTKGTTRTAGGDITMDIPSKGFGKILDQMHGLSVTATQNASTTAWTQVHNVGTSQPNKSATLQINKPRSDATDVPFTYPGAVLSAVAFNVDVGGVLKCTQTWMAKDETTPTTTPSGASLATPSYPSGLDTWTHIDAALTLNGSPLATVTSFNFTWTQPYKDDRFFMGSGGTRAKPIPNGFATITGNLAAEFVDSTLYDLYRSAAFVGLQITFTGATIASTFHNVIDFNMSAIQLRGSSPQVGGPDVLAISGDFVAMDDASNPPLVVTYTSTDTSV